MIQMKDVSKIYENGTMALDHVNVQIDKGEFVFLVGASGAGKSTFIKLLLREELPTEGELCVAGRDVVSMPRSEVPYLRRGLGVIFQDYRLLPDKTVFENVAFAMQVVGESSRVIKRRVPALLSIVNLTDKYRSYPTQLSGGEQQRVALARALANNPQIIIADEPTGNIDPKMSLEIMNLLIKIHKRGKTVIVVTHEKDLVDYFKQRVVKISDGKVVSDGVGGMFN